jgi:hypothetical protein
MSAAELLGTYGVIHGFGFSRRDGWWCSDMTCTYNSVTLKKQFQPTSLHASLTQHTGLLNYVEILFRYTNTLHYRRKIPRTHNYSLSLKYHLTVTKLAEYLKRDSKRLSTHDECRKKNVSNLNGSKKRLISCVIGSALHWAPLASTLLLSPSQQRYWPAVGTPFSALPASQLWVRVLWWGDVTEIEDQAKWMHCQESWRWKLARASTECGNC